MNKVRSIVIVDGYSSGALFPEYFRKEGVSCIHVQSTADIPAVYAPSFIPSNFIANIIHKGNLKETIAAINQFEPEQLIAGIESGVELADELSEAMGYITNGTALSLARRDKYEMVKAVQRAGVRTAKSHSSHSLEDVFSWIEGNLDYPVVIKPLKSAGTDNVAICHSPSEVEQAFANIFGRTNRLNLTNDAVLVQEFLAGKEYIVDSVTFNGHTEVCAYQESNKVPHEGAMVYENCRTIPFDSVMARTLYPYVCEVLAALAVQWGPSHMELIVTPRGPVLVEVGARLDGCRAPEHLRKAISVDQCELTVDCYLNPTTSLQRWKNYPFKVHKHLTRVFLISEKEGTFLGYGHNERIRQLPSFLKFTSLLTTGSQIVKTSNLFNTPGYIDLIHADPAVVEQDYRTIRQWEKDERFYLTQEEYRDWDPLERISR